MNTKKFNRQELERLGKNEEDIELMLKCQKTLPVLFENNDIAKYSINAIDLWNQIGSKRHFYDWSQNNIVNSEDVSEENYKEFLCKVISWDENKRTKRIDIEIIPENEANLLKGSLKSLAAKGITTSYMLTLDCAKDIVMYIGALPRTNKETKEISKTYRRYFRILEEIVHDNKAWWKVRDPEKEEYKKMSEEINNWCFRIWHRKAYRSDYAVEADMLNTIVTGKTSQQLKSEYGVASNDLIRDYLKKEHNEELLFLEQQNQVLLLMDMGFTERKNMLTKMHKVKFKSTEKVVAA